MDNENRTLTYGEQLAGVRFNPSQDPTVDELKKAAAAFMDAIHKMHATSTGGTHKLILDQAEVRALEAQMLAVKAATWSMS